MVAFCPRRRRSVLGIVSHELSVFDNESRPPPRWDRVPRTCTLVSLAFTRWRAQRAALDSQRLLEERPCSFRSEGPATFLGVERDWARLDDTRPVCNSARDSRQNASRLFVCKGYIYCRNSRHTLFTSCVRT